MGVALAGCRMALVGTGWTISHLVSTDWYRNHSSPYRGTVSGTVASFQSEGAFTGQSSLTIESSPMSGCGQGHEPRENGSYHKLVVT